MGRTDPMTTVASPTQEMDFPLRFQKTKADIHKQIVETIDITKLGHWKPERLRREVRTIADQLAKTPSTLLSEVERERLVKEIMDEIFGMGPLESLMHDPSISD